MAINVKDKYFAEAERLYVEAGLSLADINRTTGVSKSTLSRWRREGGWDEKIRVHRAAPKTAMALAEEVLAAKIRELGDVPAVTLDVKAIVELTKLVKAIEALKRTWDPYEAALAAGVAFVKYVQENVPDEAHRNIIFDAFNSFLSHAKEGGA